MLGYRRHNIQQMTQKKKGERKKNRRTVAHVPCMQHMPDMSVRIHLPSAFTSACIYQFNK